MGIFGLDVRHLAADRRIRCRDAVQQLGQTRWSFGRNFFRHQLDLVAADLDRTKVVHEAAHGIACRRFGGEVPEAGVLLLLFTPMAYVNVTSMWRFANRWHRIVVASAGMYVELFISFLSIIIWQRYPGVVGDIAFDVFMMSSVTTILFNANPLMRFDGYFILSDLLKIPNLYTKGTKWFADRIRSLYFGLPKTPNLYGPGELGRVAIYGALAFFWKITICFSLIIGASVLFYGAGMILAAIGVVLWFVVPIATQIKGLFGPAAPYPVNRRRMAISIAIDCPDRFEPVFISQSSSEQIGSRDRAVFGRTNTSSQRRRLYSQNPRREWTSRRKRPGINGPGEQTACARGA